MKITDVKVKLENKDNNLRGKATVTIDDAIAIHDIRILEGLNGLYLGMPSRKLPNGKYVDIAHPINSETRAEFEKTIYEEYEKELERKKNSEESEE